MVKDVQAWAKTAGSRFGHELAHFVISEEITEDKIIKRTTCNFSFGKMQATKNHITFMMSRVSDQLTDEEYAELTAA
jgi:hypothetical protein